MRAPRTRSNSHMATVLTPCSLLILACADPLITDPVQTLPPDMRVDILSTLKHGYVFVTSPTYTGDRFSAQNNVLQGDALCYTQAQSSQLAGKTPAGSEITRIKTWTAWLSYFDAAVIYGPPAKPSRAGDAINRLKINLGYTIYENPQIRWYGTNWDGVPEHTLFPLPLDSVPSGPLPNTQGVRFDEHGRDLSTLSSNPTKNVWTGTRGTGAQVDVTKTCLSYTLNGQVLTDARSWASLVGFGVVGNLDAEQTSWTEAMMGSNVGCTEGAHLYCFGLVP